MPDTTALSAVRDGRATLRAGGADKPAIRALQELLRALAFPVVVDGDFGARTTRMVMVMQAARGLRVDGVVGQQTLRALDAALALAAAAPSTPRAGSLDLRSWTPRPGEPALGLFRGDSFGRRVALTFDDGPRAGRTEEVLDVLARARVTATFYTLGERLAADGRLARRAADEGHRVGLHSYNHPDFMKVSTAEVVDQARRARQAAEAALGRPPLPWMRPPYGSPFYFPEPQQPAQWARVGKVYRDEGLAVMMWQVDTWDWRYQGQPHRVVQRLQSELGASGGALLMHDIHQQTAEALPGVLDVLRQRGFEVVGEEALLREKYGGGLV